MPNRHRVIVLGIDGGTWDVILPLVRSGRLPAFQRIMEGGIHGTLTSTIPHSSFPAWTTAITGVNPARHGIIDFTRKIPGRDRLVFLNSRHRGVPTIFEILSRRNLKVASLGIPCTFPPDPINGAMIGGFDCPVAVTAQRSMIHPPELASELFRKFGDYPYGSISEFRINHDWYPKARRILLRNVEKRASIFRWLWNRERWDLFWMVFPEIDTASHHFWSLHDPDSPRRDPQLVARCGSTIEEIYHRLDGILETYLDDMTDDDVLVVMSDHGFGGAGVYEIFLNKYLEQESYLRFKSGAHRFPPPLRSGGEKQGGCQPEDADSGGTMSLDRMLGVLPDKLPQWLFRRGFRWMGTLESRRRFGNIDWEHTVAFSEESNSFPGIWCRLQGRDPGGTVSNADRGALLDEIRAKLLTWRDPLTGHPVISVVYRREDIFNGPYLSLIPDLILEPALIDNRSCAISRSSRARTGNPIGEIPPGRYRGGKGIGFSGTHRKYGVFLAIGAGIEPSAAVDCDIADLSPTILSLMEEAVPQWMEGVPVTLETRRSEAVVL